MPLRPAFSTEVRADSYPDHPALAPLGEGKVLLGWLETLADRAGFEVWAGEGVEHRLLLPTRSPLGPMRAASSPDGRKALFCWTERGSGSFRAVWAEFSEDGARRLFEAEEGFSPAVCFGPDGRAVFLWICRRTERPLLLLEGEKGPIPLTPEGSGARRPAVASLPDGRLLSLWDASCGPERLGVFCSIVSPDGRAEGPILCTERLRISCAPAVAVDRAGRVFVAWDDCRTCILGRGIEHMGSDEALDLEEVERMGGHGYKLERAIFGAVLTGGKFRWLGGALDPGRPLPLVLDGVHPSLVVDDGGNVWMFYQAFDGRGGWDVWARLLSLGIDSQPQKLGGGGGPYSRSPACCPSTDGRIWVAWQKAEGEGEGRRSAIVLASFRPDAPRRAYEKPISRPVPVVRAAPRAERQERHRVEVGGERFTLFFGDLHIHTELSPCSRHKDGDLPEEYDFYRLVAGLDFAALTDHTRQFCDYDWALLGLVADLFYKPGEFVTFLAQEFAIVRPDLCFHRQIIYRDSNLPLLFRDNDPRVERNADIWRIIGDLPVIAVLHQPADAEMKRVYEDHDPRYQPVVEIYQIRGSYEKWGGPHWVYEHRERLQEEAPDLPAWQRRGKGPDAWLRRELFVQNALARGLVFGFSGGGEHEGSGITGVYARELTREAIFESLRARRCYATTGARIALDFRVEGHLMGSYIEGPARPTVEVYVKGTAPISRATIVKDNVDAAVFEPKEREVKIIWRDEGFPSAPDWQAPHRCYYVRVEQEDGHMAWSSPVFVKQDAEGI